MYRLRSFSYKTPYYYMVTLKKLKGLPPFSQITPLPRESLLGAKKGDYLVYNEITRLFCDIILTFHEKWRCLEPITCFSVMPDHIHLLLKLKPVEKRAGLAVIVWQLQKTLEKAYFAVLPDTAGRRATPTPTTALSGGKSVARGDDARPHCFEKSWHDWIVKADGQLAGFSRYIRENPYRAWLRQQNSAFFGRVTTVDFLGQKWFAYGNRALLELPVLRAFKGHRATAKDSKEWRALLAEAALIGPGGAGVSTFMSPLEKACGNAIFKAGGKLIVLSPEGFGERWHPPRNQERYCASGKMLFLSFYEARARAPSKKELYERCHNMIDLVSSRLTL